jgi:hypothetical protein
MIIIIVTAVETSNLTLLNYFRDVGGRNLFLTLVSKTDQSGSMMFKSGDCAAREDVEVDLHALQTMTGQSQLSSLKTASLFANHVWIMGSS